MTIIDEKGRFFGKINLIDFLVILFLLMSLPMFYFGYKIFNKPTVSIESIESIEIYVIFKNLSPEVAGLISVGDFEVSKDGDTTIAKVLEVGTIEPYTYKIGIELEGGQYITETDPIDKQVQVRMEIMGGVGDDAFYFRDRRIVLDSEIEFNTKEYKIEGIVTKIPESVRKYRLLKVKFTNLMPELVDYIKEGDEERHSVSGRLVAKVESVVSVNPTETLGILMPFSKSTPDHQLSIVRNSANKDIVLLIKALYVKTTKGLFFKETPLKIGNSISLETDKYDITGRIIEIKEIK